ncbi:hypothetical protein BDN72DRAFT_963759 [Pluteus cervinus]|uniref:Uncharacterized protein n=1 Tax=Pluteus cervinus TaxID=181527 RepID=A0ACD3AE43_9AGAR|nr:hypothetical protein BDN72DRAFT_963759 [Pluteus cervinus]
MSNREPYSGRTRKLVVALDVGTTFSGVSYCLLDPGQVPEIKGVTRFPYQEFASADSKIPTVIWYDKNGIIKAMGAEAVKDGIQDTAEAEDWFKSEWFKLHLKPDHIRNNTSFKIPPLPPGKSIIDVFSDFLRYLYHCTETFIREHHPNGQQLWLSVRSTVEIILSHPNGWEFCQQDQMRRAAVRAELVPDLDQGYKRIHFVTEGEASLHFCISNNVNTEAMKRGGRILVIDAGGGTIDISSYGRKMEDGRQFYEELSRAECHLKGSIFVTEGAKEHLKELLKDSRFKEDLEYISECFDRTTKPRFTRADEPAYIKFGRSRDRDPNVNIHNGHLKLLGTDVAKFFDPSVKCIIDAILGHKQYLTVSTVCLVGGFAASDWLYSSVLSAVAAKGVSLCRPDSHINKVVANGAVSYFLDHRVSSRVSKFIYGVKACENYVHSNKEHVRRKSRRFSQLSGRVCIPGAFTIILPKETKVKEQQEFRYSYHVELAQSDNKLIHRDLLCYRGLMNNPKWIDEDPDHFEILCTLEADLSAMVESHKSIKGPENVPYYVLEYDIVILFGLTELAAQVAWEENGREKRGPVRIVYDAE